MIRKYQPSDIDAIVEVWLNASEVAHPFLSETFLEQEEKNIRERYLPKTETWVFEDDHRVIGFISMLGNEVGALFLEPAFHGQGIGKAMMDWVAQKHDQLEVEVFKNNIIGKRFYEKYGFEQVREYFHLPAQQQMIRMRFKY